MQRKTAEIGEHFRAYGDQGYRASRHIQSPFRVTARARELACNSAMIAPRILVDLKWSHIVEFAFLNPKETSRALLAL